MTFNELINKYVSDTDTKQMQQITCIVSDFIEKEDCDTKNILLKKVFGVVGKGHFDENFAKHQISDMYYVDTSGVKHYAPYWTDGDLRTIYEPLKEQVKPYNFYDFMVVMNMMGSDQILKLKKWFPDATQDELLDKLVEESINWLNDEDNPFGDTKAWSYFNH